MAKKAATKRGLSRSLLGPFRKSGGQSGTSGPRRRRWLLRSVLALFVLWLIACFLVVAEPTVNKPAKVDAIVVLGPPGVDGRVTEALSLAKQKYADTVVISVGDGVSVGGPAGARSACRNDNPAYQVICFQPSPTTTRGEAEELGRLVARHHWNSLIVVTSTYHISRGRLIVQRCVPAKVLMVAAPGKPSATEWAYQFLYQTGGFVKAFLHPKC